MNRAGRLASSTVSAGRWLVCSVALSLVLPAALLIGCGSESNEVSYARDVKPIFARRCIICHFSTNQVDLIDLEDPFTADETPGPINFVSTWGEVGEPLKIDIVPYDAESSFILQKVTDLELIPGYCAPDAVDCGSVHLGEFMPKVNVGLTLEEKSAIRQWIAAGALEADWGTIAPIFGTQAGGFKQNAPSPYIPAPEKCAYCHYAGSPDPPDFTQPFDPIFGLVGAPASFRSDLLRVDPGNPDASFLMLKVDPPVTETGEPPEGSSELGSPMPRNYPALSDAEVDVLRRWILAGARNN